MSSPRDVVRPEPELEDIIAEAEPNTIKEAMKSATKQEIARINGYDISKPIINRDIEAVQPIIKALPENSRVYVMTFPTIDSPDGVIDDEAFEKLVLMAKYSGDEVVLGHLAGDIPLALSDHVMYRCTRNGNKKRLFQVTRRIDEQPTVMSIYAAVRDTLVDNFSMDAFNSWVDQFNILENINQTYHAKPAYHMDNMILTPEAPYPGQQEAILQNIPTFFKQYPDLVPLSKKGHIELKNKLDKRNCLDDELKAKLVGDAI